MQLKNRLVLGAATMLASALSIQAQCVELNFGTSIGGGDDIVLASQALGFAFPFGGATYTDVHVSTNGFVYLSNGGTPAPGGAQCCTGSTAILVGGSPMIAPYWSDLNMTGGSTVKYSATGTQAVITWENAIEYSGTDQFTVQLRLLPSGEIYFSYDGRCQIRTGGDFLVGMSEGGGAAVPAASDFLVTNSSTTTTNFELFTALGSFDLAGQTLLFVPSGLGYVWIPQPCGASNNNYGAGCYDVPGTGHYELHSDAVVASAALTGNSVLIVPSGSGYTGVWNAGGAAAYIAPTGAATPITPGDDGSVNVTLPSPMPSPYGPVTTITVSGNAIVTLDTVSNNDFDYSPSGPEFAAATGAAFYAWHDYNSAEAGSGQIKTELVGNTFCITWDGVENYSTPAAANPGTMQFQLDLASGSVTMMWTVVDTNTTTTFGTGHLIGWRADGVIADNGSQTFPTFLPATTQAQQVSMELSAAPLPISTPTTGSTVVYTTTNIPEFAPGAGVYIAINILSLGQLNPGVDLGFLGAPGCAAYVASLDVIQNMVGVTSTNSVSLPIPAGVPLGTTIYSQSAALIQPNSLPNGQNAFGMTTSNGVATSVGIW